MKKIFFILYFCILLIPRNLFCWSSMHLKGAFNAWTDVTIAGGTIVANKPHIISFSTDGSGTDNRRYWLTEITAMALVGQGFTQPSITWTGSDAVNAMIQDTFNPHIWYKTVRLTAGNQIQFKFYPNNTQYDPNAAATGDNNGWSFGDDDGTQ